MTLPPELAAALERATGSRVAGGRRVGGGDINEAWGAELEDGTRVFVKTRPDASPGEYAAEAAALRWLAQPGALLLPRVIAVADAAYAAAADAPRPATHASHADAPDVRFLALEWVQAGRLDGPGVEELGRGLAHVHAAGAPAFGATPPGTPAANGTERPPLRLGPLVLPNHAAPDWPTFYAESRLRPLASLVARRGALSAAGVRAVERVCERMAELAGPSEPPARLHGDLWRGNVLAGTDGRPRLIDPAAYGGHREVDLAMLALFGSPDARVLAAYREACPLSPGHEDRVELWQLFPLLVHAALFGGSYGQAVERAAGRYARAA
jgi:fructosamine-3-kinase